MQITDLITKPKKEKKRCVLCGVEENPKAGMYLYGKFICDECAFRIAEAVYEEFGKHRKV